MNCSEKDIMLNRLAALFLYKPENGCAYRQADMELPKHSIFLKPDTSREPSVAILISDKGDKTEWDTTMRRVKSAISAGADYCCVVNTAGHNYSVEIYYDQECISQSDGLLNLIGSSARFSVVNLFCINGDLDNLLHYPYHIKWFSSILDLNVSSITDLFLVDLAFDLIARFNTLILSHYDCNINGWQSSALTEQLSRLINIRYGFYNGKQNPPKYSSVGDFLRSAFIAYAMFWKNTDTLDCLKEAPGVVSTYFKIEFLNNFFIIDDWDTAIRDLTFEV